jgi:hypothetical protein
MLVLVERLDGDIWVSGGLAGVGLLEVLLLALRGFLEGGLLLVGLVLGIAYGLLGVMLLGRLRVREVHLRLLLLLLLLLLLHVVCCLVLLVRVHSLLIRDLIRHRVLLLWKWLLCLRLLLLLHLLLLVIIMHVVASIRYLDLFLFGSGHRLLLNLFLLSLSRLLLK